MSTLKVLDVARLIGGPVAATFLADLGADVIHVENPADHDLLRSVGTNVEEGVSSYWAVEGRNKQAITLNLRTDEGCELLRRLACDADVLVENQGAGWMEGRGLGPDTLLALNPALVYVRVSAYGQDGPYQDRKAVDKVAMSFSGMATMLGSEAGPHSPPALFMADYCAAMLAAMGAVEAVRRRDAPGGSGRGEVVDVSLYDAMLRFQASHIVDYTLNGVVKDHGAAGASPSVVSPSSLYRSRDGRWLAIVSTRGGMFERFKRAVGGDWPDGPVPRDVVEDRLASWLSQHDAAEAVDLLNDVGVCSALVSTVADLVGDPHIQKRADLVEVRRSDGTTFRMPGVIPRIGSGPEIPVRWTGQLPGAATDVVLRERLGLTSEQIDELRTAGVV